MRVLEASEIELEIEGRGLVEANDRVIERVEMND